MGFLIVALGDTEAAVRGVMGDSTQLPVLADPSGEVGSSYEIQGLPTTVFVTAGGRVAKMILGSTTADELAQVASTLH